MYEWGVSSELVDEVVPDSVEVLGGVLWRHVEEVTALVTLGVLVVNSSNGVKWLVNISKIVDEKSQGIRLGLIIITNMLFNSLVDEWVLVSVCLGDPVHDGGDDGDDVVLGVVLEVGVVVHGTALIEVGDIGEMPWTLPGAALCLNLISKSGALNEWIASFEVSEWGVSVSVDLEQVVGCLESLGGFLLQSVVRNSRNYKQKILNQQ